MPQQFAIGDVVKLNNTEQEGVVDEILDQGNLLHVSLMPTRDKLYWRHSNVTFVRSGTTGQGEQPAPGKIET